MLVNDKDAKARLTSSGNLMNMLRNGLAPRRPNAMSIFAPAAPDNNSAIAVSPPRFVNPFRPSATPANPTPVLPSDEDTKVVEPEVLPPTTDDLLSNADAQIKLARAHDRALNLIGRTLETIETKIDDMKPEKLPAVLSAAGRIVESIRKEKLEQTKDKRDRQVHFHFYEPARKEITEYETMEV